MDPKSFNSPRLNAGCCPTVLPTEEGTGELVESAAALNLLSLNVF